MSPVAVPSLHHRSPEELGSPQSAARARFQLPRRRRHQGDGRRDARARPRGRDPAGLDRRAHQRRSRLAPAGGRQGPAWPPPVQVPPGLDRLPRPGQVRPPAGVRQRASRGPQADRHRPGAPRRPTREGPRHHRRAPADHAHPRGNEEYAKENGAYGLTTLRNKHAHVSGAEISFMFTGKSGIEHEVRAARSPWHASSAIARRSGASGSSSTSTTTARPRPSTRTTSTSTSVSRRHRHHGQGLPHVGGDGRDRQCARPDGPARVRARGEGDGQGGDRRGGAEPRQHADRVQGVVRASARPRDVLDRRCSRRPGAGRRRDVLGSPSRSVARRHSWVDGRARRPPRAARRKRCVHEQRSASRVGEKTARQILFPTGGRDMNDPVAILKRDHREVAQMLKTLEASKPGARRRQTVDKLTQALELHMEIEERDIYPVVSASSGRKRPRKPASSTAWRRRTRGPAAAGRRARLRCRGGDADRRHQGHVKEEEQEVFPELKRKIDRDEPRSWVTGWPQPRSRHARTRARSLIDDEPTAPGRPASSHICCDRTRDAHATGAGAPCGERRQPCS